MHPRPTYYRSRRTCTTNLEHRILATSNNSDRRKETKGPADSNGHLLLLITLSLPLSLSLSQTPPLLGFAFCPESLTGSAWPYRHRTSPVFEIAIAVAATSRLQILGWTAPERFPRLPHPRQPDVFKGLPKITTFSEPRPSSLLLAPGPDPPSATLALGPRSYNSYCAGKPLLHLALPTYTLSTILCIPNYITQTSPLPTSPFNISTLYYIRSPLDVAAYIGPSLLSQTHTPHPTAREKEPPPRVTCYKQHSKTTLPLDISTKHSSIVVHSGFNISLSPSLPS
ncbi:hypothetical protein HRG_014182 [Hirsutella rhossiliensis]